MTMVPIVDGPRPPARAAPVQCGGVRDGPGRCPASTAFWRSLRVAEVHEPRCDLPADVGIEAVPGQQRIRPRPTLARVGDACQGSAVAFEEALGGVAVRLGTVRARGARRGPMSIVARSMPFTRSSSRIARSPRGRARSRDSTHARANASSSRIPSSSSRSMAPSTRSVPVARAAEPASNLGHRALARLEEARRGIEDDLGIVDRPPPLALLRR